MDQIRREADQNDLGAGRGGILTSTFTGSPRNMHQNYQDAMLILKKGKPDFFITVTVNQKSPNIANYLLPHQAAVDRPDLVYRVFQSKIKANKDAYIPKRGMSQNHPQRPTTSTKPAKTIKTSLNHPKRPKTGQNHLQPA